MKSVNLAKLVTLIVIPLAALAFIIPAQATKMMTGKDFVSECKPSIETVTVQKARAMHDAGGWVFLDVRTEKEFKKGAIPQAMHLARGLLEFRVEQIVPDKTVKIIVYCKTGGRSALAVCTLKKMGYANAVSMDGGWTHWLKEGHPVG
jgi:rhodanese-related sulfurtransferase